MFQNAVCRSKRMATYQSCNAKIVLPAKDPLQNEFCNGLT